MFRVDADAAVVNLPSPEPAGAVSGFYDKGNPALGIRATQVSFDHMNAIQETLIDPIEEVGIGLSKAAPYNKLTQAIIALSNMRQVETVTEADFTFSNLDLIKLLRVQCGSSNRTVTLPAANQNEGRIICIEKTDEIDNITTGVGRLIISGSIAGYTSLELVGKNETVELYSNGSEWVVLSFKNSFYRRPVGILTGMANAVFEDLNSVYIPEGFYRLTHNTRPRVDYTAFPTFVEFVLRFRRNSDSTDLFSVSSGVPRDDTESSRIRLAIDAAIDLSAGGYTIAHRLRTSGGTVTNRRSEDNGLSLHRFASRT